MSNVTWCHHDDQSYLTLSFPACSTTLRYSGQKTCREGGYLRNNRPLERCASFWEITADCHIWSNGTFFRLMGRQNNGQRLTLLRYFISRMQLMLMLANISHAGNPVKEGCNVGYLSLSLSLFLFYCIFLFTIVTVLYIWITAWNIQLWKCVKTCRACYHQILCMASVIYEDIKWDTNVKVIFFFGVSGGVSYLCTSGCLYFHGFMCRCSRICLPACLPACESAETQSPHASLQLPAVPTLSSSQAGKVLGINFPLLWSTFPQSQ